MRRVGIKAVVAKGQWFAPGLRRFDDGLLAPTMRAIEFATVGRAVLGLEFMTADRCDDFFGDAAADFEKVVGGWVDEDFDAHLFLHSLRWRFLKVFLLDVFVAM